MTMYKIIKGQGWKKIKEDKGIKQFELEDGRDTLKIYLAKNTDSSLIKSIKEQLWNEYYSRVLLYKNNNKNKFFIWTNNQSPEKDGEVYDEKPFNESISPVDYWDRYISKSSKNTVDKMLEKNILIIFEELRKKYKEDDAIQIILACTFICFLEDRNITDVKNDLITSLESKTNTIKLFNEYKVLHNGMLFKSKVLQKIDEDTCELLLKFFKNKLSAQPGLFDFNFKYIPVELISSVYEKLLTEKLGQKKKKDQGIAYTPPKLANFVVKEAFKEIKNKQIDFSKLKIADLSVGSGIFLVLSFRKLLEELNRNTKKTFNQKVKILINSLYGIDLDSSAKDITIFSLYVELLENENKKLSQSNKFPILNNIKKLDTLKFLEKNNFFDLIIGNPPWKSRDDSSYSKIIKRKFVGDICNKELSQIFTHISLEKIKEGGILSLILPTAIFYNPGSFKFRNSILDKSIIKSFIDFSALRSILFKNSVEASVLVAEKDCSNAKQNYTVVVKRALNKADYLYFNHVSGEINYINSNFLKSRNDSWQIATRGGNPASVIIKRLSNDFDSLGNIIGSSNISKGYQGTKGDTIQKNITSKCKTKLIYNPDEICYCNELKKSSNSHALLKGEFIKNECLLVYARYKFKDRLNVLFKKNNVSFSEYFIGLKIKEKEKFYFTACLLSSRLAMFFVNMVSTTAPLLPSEQKNPKFSISDIKNLPFLSDYKKYTTLLKIGKILIANEFKNLKQVQQKIDNEIEKIFKVNNFERHVLKKWEIITGRKKSNGDLFKEYQAGFEKMLSDFSLEKPNKWNITEKNGVQIISFTGDNKFATLKNNNKIFNEVLTAKKNIGYKFVTDNRGIILRRKNNNFGYMTGLSDAEYILSTI